MAITNYQTTANGCSSLDKNFTNFAVSSASSSVGVTTPSLTNLFFYESGGSLSASGTGFSTPGIAGSVDAFLSGTNLTGTNVWDLPGGGDQTSAVTVTDDVQASGKPTGAGANATLSYVISGLTLTPAGTATWTGTAGGATTIESIVIAETFCLNAITTTGCAAADLGEITGTLNATGTSGTDSTFTFMCTGGSAITCPTATSSSATFIFAIQVATSETVTLTRDSGIRATVDLNNFDSLFQESGEMAPEPSTLVLLGAALAGTGALRYRRKRA